MIPIKEEYRVVTLGDTQFRPARNGEPSGEDPKVLREIVLPFIKMFKPRTVVHKGDLIDLPSLSKYESHLGDAEAVETALTDYRYTNEWLDEIDEAAHGALDYVIEGNHEVRAKKWSARASRRHLRDTVNVEKNLRFKERGIRYVPYWSNKIKLLTLGKANFCHGLSTAPTHARVMAGKYPGMNLYYGHTHDRQFYSPHYLHEVGSDGCLCRLYQPYNEGAPTNWRHGFSAFTFFKGGGYICEPILIVNGRMCFGGKLFKGR